MPDLIYRQEKADFLKKKWFSGRSGKMYRNELQRKGFLSCRLNRSTGGVATNAGTNLIPYSYSDGICIYTVGPCQVYSYQYTTKKSSKKTYISEMFFYPKVVHKKYISALVHFPAKNNAKSHTVYKDMICFVPRCLNHFETKKIITEPIIEELHKTGLQHTPRRSIREFTSSIRMATKTLDRFCWRCNKENVHNFERQDLDVFLLEKVEVWLCVCYSRCPPGSNISLVDIKNLCLILISAVFITFYLFVTVI